MTGSAIAPISELPTDERPVERTFERPAGIEALAATLLPASRKTIQERLGVLGDDPELIISLRCHLERHRELSRGDR